MTSYLNGPSPHASQRGAAAEPGPGRSRADSLSRAGVPASADPFAEDPRQRMGGGYAPSHRSEYWDGRDQIRGNERERSWQEREMERERERERADDRRRNEERRIGGNANGGSVMRGTARAGMSLKDMLG